MTFAHSRAEDGKDVDMVMTGAWKLAKKNVDLEECRCVLDEVERVED